MMYNKYRQTKFFEFQRGDMCKIAGIENPGLIGIPYAVAPTKYHIKRHSLNANTSFRPEFD